MKKAGLGVRSDGFDEISPVPEEELGGKGCRIQEILGGNGYHVEATHTPVKICHVVVCFREYRLQCQHALIQQKRLVGVLNSTQFESFEA
jgi:hypothetical protein